MIHIKRQLETYDVIPEVIKRIIDVGKKSIQLPENLSLEDFVFFDIETTGFDPEYSRLTLAGIFYYLDGKWYVEQWFTETRKDEKNVSMEMNNALMYFKKIVTYNGNGFDIPYIEHKLKKYELKHDYLKNRSLDLYPLVKKIKKKYEFPNAKLKTVEKMVGIERGHMIEGEEIVTYYAKATEDGSEFHRDELLKYNAEDVIYLPPIMFHYLDEFFPEMSGKQEVASVGQISIFDM